jgi:hypothetical protein
MYFIVIVQLELDGWSLIVLNPKKSRYISRIRRLAKEVCRLPFPCLDLAAKNEPLKLTMRSLC